MQNCTFDDGEMVSVTDTQMPTENNERTITAAEIVVQSAAMATSVAAMLLTSKAVLATSAISLGTALACDKLSGSTDYKNTKMVAGAIGIAAAGTSNLGGFINNQTANAVFNHVSEQTTSSRLAFYAALVAPLCRFGWLYRAAAVAAPVVTSLASKPANITLATQVGKMLEKTGDNVGVSIANTSKAIVTGVQSATDRYIRHSMSTISISLA
jgi:hypothetical protein